MVWFLSLTLVHVLAIEPGAPSSFSSPTIVARPSPQAMLTAENRRVRSSSPRLVKAIAEGVRRSPTFARLVAALHDTNVIVYVEPSFALPPEMSGRLLFSTVAGNQRYLRIQVGATIQGDQLISLIGHELRHALEVAVDPTVVDEVGLVRLYRRIGDGGGGMHLYDTEAARVTGRTIRNELVG